MALTFQKLSKPPVKEDAHEWYRWHYRIVEVLNGLIAIAIKHNQIEEVLEADDTDTDTVEDKHVSNAMVKKYEDHRLITDGNPHGTNWDQLEETVNFIPMNVAPTGVPLTAGTLSWDSEHQCLTVQPDDPLASLQVGQEDWVHVTNTTGTDIANGKVVAVNGAVGDHPTVTLALASDAGNLGYTLGIATTVIKDGAQGFVTVRGLVHGFDTSSYPLGTILYVDDAVPGGFTSSQPMPPSYTLAAAYTLNSAVDGIIYVRFDSPDASIKSTLASVATKDPTGFNYNDTITVTYDATTRTVTLVGNLQYSWRGAVRQLASPWTSSAHPVTLDKLYFLSSPDGVNFSWADIPWEFSVIQVSYVFYGTTDKFAMREVHGLMGWQTHEEFHTIIGCYRRSGGGLTGYTPASTTPANRRPDVALTVVKDEDVFTQNAALTTKLYTKMYLTGAGAITFTVETAEIVPIASGDIPAYNQFVTPNWVQTPMSTNNTYMSIWLVGTPATADVTSQKHRFIWVQGQTVGTLAEQQALTPTSLELDGLRATFSEFCFMTQIIIRFVTAGGGAWEITSVKDLTRRIGL